MTSDGKSQLFIVTILVLMPLSTLEMVGDSIAAVSIGKTHTRLRLIRDSPKTLMRRLNTLRKGGKIVDIAHASLPVHQWTALEHDFRRKEFFILDRQAGKILVAVDAPGYVNKTRVLYEGVSHKVQATAYDWLRRDFYWGDPSFNAIFRLPIGRLCRGATCMTSLSRARYSKTTRRHRNNMASVETVIGEDVYKPYGMTIDPARGYLYWTDDELSRSIYTSTLDGTNRTVLVTGLIRPTSLTLDYTEMRLFWIDRMTETSVISSCDLKKKACLPKRVTDIYSSRLYDLDFHKGFLIMADHFDRLVIYNEASGQILRQHWLGKAHGVNICSKERQIQSVIPSDDHFRDKEGVVFSDIIKHGVILLASERSGILMVERTFTMGQEPRPPYLFLADSGITTMAADVTRRQLFYFKRPEKMIYKVTIPVFVNESRVPIATSCMTSWIDDVNAMAVDWTTGNLYWLDSGFQRLMMSNSMCQFPTVIHYRNISRPQDLVIHSEKKYLFWSDMGDEEPRIERSRLDGKRRRVILAGKNIFYARPHALTLDLKRNKIYWSDGPFVCRATLNGKLFEDCKPRDMITKAAIKAMDIMHDYVIWTDFIAGLGSADTHRDFPLTRANRRKWFEDDYYSDVIYIHSSKQPIQKDPCRKGFNYPEPLVKLPDPKSDLSYHGKNPLTAAFPSAQRSSRALPYQMTSNDAASNTQSDHAEFNQMNSYRRCSQICIPTPLLPRCRCTVGYWRKPGGVCVPGVTRDHFLIITDLRTGKLFRQFALLPHYYAVPTFGDTRGFDVTIDEASNKMYWLDYRRNANMIFTSDFLGRKQSVVLAGTEFNITSIKSAFDLLFMLTSSGQVTVMGLTSGIFTDVIDDENLFVTAMFVDKRSRHLYLSANRKVQGHKRNVAMDTAEGVIMRSNLDGTDLRTIYRSSGRPAGLAVYEQYLYWIDTDGKAIYSVPLNGSNISDLNKNSTIRSEINRKSSSTASSSNSKYSRVPLVDRSFSNHYTSERYFTAGTSRPTRGAATHPLTTPSRKQTTPSNEYTLKPRTVIILPPSSKPREIIISPDGDVYFTDATKQSVQKFHVDETKPPRDAGFPYMNRIGGIAYFDSRNKLNPPTSDSYCSGIQVPLPGNQSRCLCDIGLMLRSEHCKNKLNRGYKSSSKAQGLCLVTAVTQGHVLGADINNYVLSGQEITVSCVPGYLLSESKIQTETRKCLSGRWNSTSICRRSIGYHIQGNKSRGYVIFMESMPFYVPRDVRRLDVICIGGGGGGFDPCGKDLFGKRTRAGMGGVSKFGHYLRAHGGQGGAKSEGGRGGSGRNLFGGMGRDSSDCLGGGAAGETRKPDICRLGSTSCPFCGAGGVLVRCHKCPIRPEGCGGWGSMGQGEEAADSFGGGASGAKGGWGGGGGGYSRKSVRVSPFEKVLVKVGRRGFPTARPAADGLVIVAWGGVIEKLVAVDKRKDVCKPFIYEDRLVTKDTCETKE